MAKLAQSFAKYLINATLTARGVVERSDIVGAIFGQTEGLLGSDLDLRELQRTGRIGRIEVTVKNENGSTRANIIIPSSLDTSETCLIAASLEAIEKVGPCDADIRVTSVEDVRSQKRKFVVERAKELMKNLIDDVIPNSQEITEQIRQSIRTAEISHYKGLTCGPDALKSEELIIVEGRADVLNLLKHGVRNTVAIEGSKIPEAIIGLSKEKTTTAFLDGDRGGELDLKKLLELADIDFVTRAPHGKEVEELTKKEIFKALRDKTPANVLMDEYKIKKQPMQNHNNYHKYEHKNEHYVEQSQDNQNQDNKKLFGKLLEEIVGTKAAYIVNNKGQTMAKAPISELQNLMMNYSNIYAIVFDGRVDQAIINLSKQKNIRYIVCMGYQERVSTRGIKIYTMKDFEQHH